MKKLISIVLSAALLFGISASLTSCGENREEVLKIYMPGEYIDEDILEEFSAWYKGQTGKTVTVTVKAFDAVEDILKAVEQNKSDYDLLVPSDYMVEYLVKKDLVKPVNKSIIDITEAGLFKEAYIESTREFDPELKYSVPYMYGTLGLVYDMTKTGKKIDSWDALFGDEFKGTNPVRRSVKDSIRDTYVAACLYNESAVLNTLSGAEKKAKVQSIFEDTSAETIEKAKNTLSAFKAGGARWDVDDLKFEMAAGSSDVAVALMWSCDAGYVMNDYDDNDGNKQSGNRNLWYVVPKEGGNVYIDSFVISKYAANEEAANYFLKFLCQKDIAVKNSDYAGCISPVAAAYDELLDYYTDDTANEGLFDGTAEGWKEMFIEMMFPSEETLNRCGVMKDFGAGKDAVVKMWGNVKG
ncbi:MAG: extracellular solute-binding protein [Clostridia bacterium]|nr:extracellular solute-binding protein [Clostridia bacterium]